MKLTKSKLKEMIREELLKEKSNVQTSYINTNRGRLMNSVDVDGDTGTLSLGSKVIATYQYGGGGTTKGKVKDIPALIDAVSNIIWEKGRHS